MAACFGCLSKKEYLHEIHGFNASIRKSTDITVRLGQVKFKDRLEKGFVPAGESLSGVVWLEMCCCINPATEEFKCYCCSVSNEKHLPHQIK